MYSHSQTLMHKKTKKLARLVSQHEASTWAWDIGKNTLFVDEHGNEFGADINEYTHVADWLGRAMGGYVKEGAFVADLKLYAEASKEDREARKEQYLIDWECDVLGEMEEVLSEEDEKMEVHCPFADGADCPTFRDYFLAKRQAIPLHKSLNSIQKEYTTQYCRQYIFKYKDRLWMYDDQMHWLVLLDLEYMITTLINKLIEGK